MLVQAVSAVTPEQYQPAPDPPPNPPPAPAPAVPGDAEPQVAAVYSPAQFQHAFRTGARDIEVREHLDLRTLAGGTLAWQDTEANIGAVPGTIRSIRVRGRAAGTFSIAQLCPCQNIHSTSSCPTRACTHVRSTHSRAAEVYTPSINIYGL